MKPHKREDASRPEREAPSRDDESGGSARPKSQEEGDEDARPDRPELDRGEDE